MKKLNGLCIFSSFNISDQFSWVKGESVLQDDETSSLLINLINDEADFYYYYLKFAHVEKK